MHEIVFNFLPWMFMDIRITCDSTRTLIFFLIFIASSELNGFCSSLCVFFCYSIQFMIGRMTLEIILLKLDTTKRFNSKMKHTKKAQSSEENLIKTSLSLKLI